MPIRRSHVSLRREPALHATRASTKDEKLVYVLVADKKLRYGTKRSRIAYIGTTKRGVIRISSSVAHRAEEILTHRGVYEFTARVVVCNPRRHVKMWHQLERAMLLKFKEIYGEVPLCNTQGERMRAGNEFRYFREKRIETILEDLS